MMRTVCFLDTKARLGHWMQLQRRMGCLGPLTGHTGHLQETRLSHEMKGMQEN